MMSETVVTMDGSSNNASNNPRQVPTVKTEPGQPNPLNGIRLNVPYFKTIPGILKLVQLVSDIVRLAVYPASRKHPRLQLANASREFRVSYG